MATKKADKGWHMTPNKLARAGSSVSCSAYRVYGVIASYSPSHPSYSRIGQETGLSRSTVGLAIRELCQSNIIQVTRKGHTGGIANEYRLNSPDQWTLPSSIIELGRNSNQDDNRTTPSTEFELGQNSNQDDKQPTSSTIIEPDLVRLSASNNTNIIIPNKKTNTAKADSGGSNGHTPPTPTQADPPSNGVHFDFEALYKLFPKRGKDMKKSLGMQKCKAQIRTQEQYDKLKSAVIHYDEHIKSEKRKRFDFENSFIKTWGHFMSKTYWVDWIKPNGHSSDKEIIVCGKENTCSPKEDSIL
jgi:DNA-binding transcriptional regulator GbsR (MarR family)